METRAVGDGNMRMAGRWVGALRFVGSLLVAGPFVAIFSCGGDEDEPSACDYDYECAAGEVPVIR